MIPARALRRATGAALVILVVAACGDANSSVSLDPGDSVVFESPTPTASASASSVVPSATASPSASVLPSTAPTAAPSEAPSAGPSTTPAPVNISQDLCALLPAANVETALGVTGLTARAEQGDATAGYCTYLAGDRAVAATSYLTAGGNQVLDTYAGLGESVSGLGDEALWIQDKLTLFVRKGDRLIGIQLPAAGPVGPDSAKDACVALGQTVAGRF